MEENRKEIATPMKNMQPSLGYFQPELLEQALRVADKFFKAGCFGSDVKSPEQAFVKIQAGAEMGMAPMESMNSLYIINGHITIWGMALSRRLREHGWKIEYLESTEKVAKVKISKGAESYEYEATADELTRLGSMFFKKDPKDKLRWHALSRLVRFNVPEVLGPISYTQQEMEDVVVTTVVENPIKFVDLQFEIENCETVDDYKKMGEKISKVSGVLTADEIKELRKLAVAKKKSLLEQKEEPAEESKELSEAKQEEIITPQDHE